MLIIIILDFSLAINIRTGFTVYDQKYVNMCLHDDGPVYKAAP